METLNALAPVVVLVAVTLGLLTAGAAGVSRLRPWPVALRGGLAAMFVLTGVSHFAGMRAELIAMVPPALPAPGALVSISGVLELAGALGVLLPATTRLAASCLAALLVAVFPANLHAALDGLATNPVDALVPRTLMQLVFLLAALAVAVFPPTGPDADPVPRERALTPSP